MPEIEQGQPERIDKISQEAFARRVNRYPNEAQEAVALFSSTLLESDMADRVNNDPDSREAITDWFRKVGLPKQEVAFVFQYLGVQQEPPGQE